MNAKTLRPRQRNMIYSAPTINQALVMRHLGITRNSARHKQTAPSVDLILPEWQ